MERTLDGEILCDGSLDLIKGTVWRFGRDRTNGNDYSSEEVVAADRPGGVVMGLSRSGDALTVVRTLKLVG